MVNTVLGPVPVSELGMTLMHEHIVNIEWNIARAFPEYYNKESVVDMFCQEAQWLKEHGVRTIVDATPITLGRDVSLLRACAEKSGMNIIACTGLYWNVQPFFHYGIDAQVVADLMLREVEKGMEGTDSLPGFVKCAANTAIAGTEFEEAIVTATAMVAKETGLPVYTHTQPGSRMALRHKEIFDAYGVPAHKVAYGHTFSIVDEEYIRSIIAGGGWASCDQLCYAGAGKLDPLEKQLDMVEKLFREDLHKSIFLSCDWGVRSDFGGTLLASRVERNQNPKPTTRRVKMLFEQVVPELEKRGIPREKILEVFIDNPRRYFGN